MRGLDPRTHAFLATERHEGWVAGSSPAMTSEDCHPSGDNREVELYSKRLLFGNPFGGRRPDSARLPIQSRRSSLPTVQVRPAVSRHVNPSASRNTFASEM